MIFRDNRHFREYSSQKWVGKRGGGTGGKGSVKKFVYLTLVKFKVI